MAARSIRTRDGCSACSAAAPCVPIVASLAPEKYKMLHKLEQCLNQVIKGVGGLSHQKWRSFYNERKVEEAKQRWLEGERERDREIVRKRSLEMESSSVAPSPSPCARPSSCPCPCYVSVYALGPSSVVGSSLPCAAHQSSFASPRSAHIAVRSTPCHQSRARHSYATHPP